LQPQNIISISFGALQDQIGGCMAFLANACDPTQYTIEKIQYRFFLMKFSCLELKESCEVSHQFCI